MNPIRLTLVALCALVVSACGPKLIPNLDFKLADTPDHRSLLDLMAKYQSAYEGMDIDALVALASLKFYEPSGTAKTDDDYSYDGLKTHFTEHFKLIKKIQLKIDIKGIKVKEDSATVNYRYVTRYLMDLPAGEKWQITDEVNRLTLAREEGDWKVLSGF